MPNHTNPSQESKKRNSIFYRITRILLWVGLFAFGLATIPRIGWVGITPKGFWIFPRIRSIQVPPIPEDNFEISQIAVRLPEPINGIRYRLAPSELAGLKPGDRIWVMNCMFFADNQPNIYRVTPLRILSGYPEFFMLIFIMALPLHKRLTRRSTRTLPL